MTQDAKFIVVLFSVCAIILSVAMTVRVFETKYNYELYKELYNNNNNVINELQVTNEALRDSLLNIHIDYQRCLNTQARRQTR